MQTTSPVRVARWLCVARSVRGAAHARAGVANQDAVLLSTEGPFPILAVADGHGSARCKRSDRGAYFAVHCACACVRELWPQVEAMLPGEGTPENEPRWGAPALLAWWRSALPARLAQAWRARVDADLLADPISVQTNRYLAYGTTLLLAAATPAGLLLAQIGDGEILAVDAAGGVSRPLPGDPRLIANETTSLAGDPARETRMTWLRPESMPALLLLATDGYPNSCQDQAAFDQVGKDLLGMIRNEGIAPVEQNLTNWLSEVSAEGSGDDVSLGLMYNRDHREAPDEVLVPLAPAVATLADSTVPADSVVPASIAPVAPQPVPVPTAKPASKPVKKRPGTVLPPAKPTGTPKPPKRGGRGPLMLFVLVALVGLWGLAYAVSSLLMSPTKAKEQITQEEQKKPEETKPKEEPPQQKQPEERPQEKPPAPPRAKAELWKFTWTPMNFGEVKHVAICEMERDLKLAACGPQRFAMGAVRGTRFEWTENSSEQIGAIVYSSDGRLTYCSPHVLAVATSSDGRHQLTGFPNGEVWERSKLQWQTSTGQSWTNWSGYYLQKKMRDPAIAVRYTAEKDVAFCISKAGELTVLRIGKRQFNQFGHATHTPTEGETVQLGELACCALTSRDRKWLVVAPEDGKLYYATSSVEWEEIEIVGEGFSKLSSMALTEDAKILATGHKDGQVRLWKLNIPNWHSQPKK